MYVYISFLMILLLLQALLNKDVYENYSSKIQSLGAGAMEMSLYYCGSLENPERIKDILKNGFSDKGQCARSIKLRYMIVYIYVYVYVYVRYCEQ